MKKFIIGKDDFGIEKVTCQIDKENSIINELRIIGDKITFEKLSGGKKSKWDWALYPPELYFREIPFELKKGRIEIEITEDILDDFDIALYLMEHNDIIGKLIIDESYIFTFEGYVDISGDEFKLKVEANIVV
jgi:hypothetical protein